MTDPIPASQIEPRSKALVRNIGAMQSSREGFAKAERCEKLRLALNLKMRSVNRDYNPGDLVYYKRDKDDKWLGPAKVIFQDSKVIGIRTTTGYVRVSANRLWPAGQTLSERLRDEDEQLERIKQGGKEGKNQDKPKDEEKIIKVEESSDDEAFEEARDIIPDAQNDDNDEEIVVDTQVLDNPQIDDNEDNPANRQASDNSPIEAVRRSPEKFKILQRIEFKDQGKWERGIVIGQAGKKSGKYKHFYNVKLDSGKEFSADFAKSEVRKETDNVEDQALTTHEMMNLTTNLSHMQQDDCYDIKLDSGKVITTDATNDIADLDDDQILATWLNEEVLAVMLPKEKRDTPECLEAKHTELQKLIDFETYKVVEDKGQPRITTTWVLTLKGHEIKARLTARGFQEEDEHPKESPTMQKYSLRTLLAIAAAKGWPIETVDVKSAFLQGSDLTRQVYVKPPKEVNQPDKLWLLIKCLYGLRDASRQWYNKVQGVLENLGFEKCTYDSGLFFLMIDGNLEALVGLHVDDFLNAGGQIFHSKILPQILSTFKVGKSECGNFMYTGFQLNQDSYGVTLDQAEYVDNLSIPEFDNERMKQSKAEMTFDELSLLRKMTGQLNWTVRSTRPDLSFNMIACSTHFKGGTVADLKYARKTLNTLKQTSAVLRFSKLECLETAEIWLFTDASYGNLNGGTDSTQGYVLFLVNPRDGKCAPIDWRANKINRVVTSTLAAEAVSLTRGLDAAVSLKWTLQELLGKEGNMAVRAIIDNKDTFDSVHSTTDVTERKLRREIGAVKQMMKDKELEQLIWVRGPYQLADPLTKLGANSDALTKVMHEGQITQEILDAVRG